VAASQTNKQKKPTKKSPPGLWGDLNAKYVTTDITAEMGWVVRYLDKGKTPDRDDPDGLPTLSITG
jgi:hypothetical protein